LVLDHRPMNCAEDVDCSQQFSFSIERRTFCFHTVCFVLRQIIESPPPRPMKLDAEQSAYAQNNADEFHVSVENRDDETVRMFKASQM